MRDKIQKIVVQAVAGTKDLTEAIDELCVLSDIVEQSEQLKPFKCPNCGNEWNIKKTNSCECGAIVKR